MSESLSARLLSTLERLANTPGVGNDMALWSEHASAVQEAAARVDPPRTCLTPETYYDVSQTSARVLTVKLRFPFDIDDWASGACAIQEMAPGVDPTSDAERLRRYDERDAERGRIVNMIHDQMETVGADCYRVLLDRDRRLGEDRVDYGIRHARWKRTRQGDRPSPAHRNRLAGL